MAEQPQEPEQQAISVNQPSTVAAVALKLPPFWPTNPVVWVAQVEAQFSFRNVVQQHTRFDYIIAALAPEVATEVRDLILNPPADQPYHRLKEALIQRIEASKQWQFQQLLTAEEVRRPQAITTVAALRLMGLTVDLLGSAQEDPTAIAAIAAGEIQCVLATPETLLNNPVHRNMPLSKVYQDNLISIVVDEAHCTPSGIYHPCLLNVSKLYLLSLSFTVLSTKGFLYREV